MPPVTSNGHSLSEAYAARRPQSCALFRRADDVLAGQVGHDLRHFEPVPLYISRGQGSRKWDVDGNEYIDFLMGNGAVLLGHADPDVVQAIAQAAPEGTHFGSDHPRQIEWAELVQRLVPTAERVRFVNSGSEAVALALRLARAATGRHKVLRFHGHFHGWLDGVIHGFHPPFDADGSLGVPPSTWDAQVSIPDGDPALVDEVLSNDRDVAAVILEPSGASWGRVPIEAGFLRELRDVTSRHGALLIFDEVITGFRWSSGGAQELYGVLPDLSCFAKILAGGMPGGAVVGPAEILDLFRIRGDAQHDRFRRVTHFGTFNASPLAAAAGIAVLQRVAGGEAIERANRRAAQLRASWDRVLEEHGIAGYVYGPCSTFHVYFETDERRLADAGSRADLRTTDARRLKGLPGALTSAYQRWLRHYGVDVMSATGGVLSAAHTAEDIERATRAFERTVCRLRDAGLIHTLKG